MAEEQLSPSIAAAVFEVGVGGITEVVTTSEGLLIAKVNEVLPAETIAFDSVKAEIARTITSEKGVGSVAQAYADRILESWKTDGTPNPELLTEQNVLALETPTFPIAAPGFPGLSDSAELLKAIEGASDVGLLDAVYPVPGGRLIAEITLLSVPSDADFEKDKDQIRKRMEALSRNDWVAAWKDDLVSQADVVQYWRP
jgi:hypothetical protein